MQPENITDLERIIFAEHASEYSRTELVREVMGDGITWDGFVCVFRVIGHPKANCCYAWSYQEGNETKTMTVLDIPPIDSPQSAVKEAIASKARDK
jgi:hypothetical protein